MPLLRKPVHSKTLSTTTPKTSLIIAPNWIGDTIMAQTLFKLIKHTNPQRTIDVLAPAWTHPVLKYMPEVHHCWLSSFEHGKLQWRERRALAKQLRIKHYDQAIILPNSLKSALIPFWSRIPTRIGYKREGRGCLFTDARTPLAPHSPTVKRFAKLGLPETVSLPDKLPYPHLQINKTSLQKTLAALAVIHPQPPLIVALCPGAAYGPAKRWPEEHFSTVAKTLHARGWAVWLFGSPKETEITERIQAYSNNSCLNFAGKSSLAQTIDLLSLATAVIANDSGLMHIACALDKPVAALYGSTPPSLAPPLSDKAQIFTHKTPCSPCFKRVCPLDHLNCLRGIDPAGLIDWATRVAKRGKEN